MAKRKWSEEEIAEYRRIHNSYMFYYNKEDANLFVPRADIFTRWSITGMTFNWAHPIPQIFAIIILALVFLPVIFNSIYGGR